MKKLAIIILNWNGAEDTIECLESLEKNDIYDIFLLDNGSDLKDKKKIHEYLVESKFQDCFLELNKIELFDKIKLYYVLSETNMGFARGNNYIVTHIVNDYNYILLLNNDTVVPGETIPSMIETIDEKKVVALTCDIRYFEDKEKLWNAGGKFTWYGERKYYSQKKIERKKKRGVRYLRAEFITGCALLIDSKYIREYGLFTEKFFHGEEDFNFCINAKKNGKELGVDLSVELYHKVGQSIKANQNDIKVFNAMTVHYCNRVIDYKCIYSKLRWFFWRELYLVLVFLKRTISDMDFRTGWTLICRIRKITDRYDNVEKELFDAIMNMEIGEKKYVK